MADIPTDMRGPYFTEEAPEMGLVDRDWELRFMTNDKQCIVITADAPVVKTSAAILFDKFHVIRHLGEALVASCCRQVSEGTSAAPPAPVAIEKGHAHATLVLIILVVPSAIYVLAVPLAVFAALTILGTRDLLQTRHSVLRNYPISAYAWPQAAASHFHARGTGVRFQNPLTLTTPMRGWTRGFIVTIS